MCDLHERVTRFKPSKGGLLVWNFLLFIGVYPLSTNADDVSFNGNSIPGAITCNATDEWDLVEQFSGYDRRW